MYKQKIRVLKISLLMLIAAVLRIIGITSADLWRDEAFSVRTANQSLGRTIEIIAADTAPPLHSILLNFWIKIFGDGELAVRMLSYIFGMLALFVIFKIVEIFFKKEKNILITLILAAINPVLIYYSQEARSYSMLLFFSSTSLYFTLKILQKKEITKDSGIGLLVSTILGLYTHNLFVFIAFINFVIAVFYIDEFKTIKKYLRNNKAYLMKLGGIYLISGLVFLPWFVIMLKQMKTVSEGGFWLKLSPIKDPAGTIGMIYSGHYFNTNNDINIIIAALLGLFGALLLITSIGIIFKKENRAPIRTGLLTWFWGILILIWLYSSKTSFFYIRYLLFVIPAALILSVISYIRINKISNKVGYILLALLIGASLYLVKEQIEYLPKSKANMSTLVGDIDKKDGDLILHADAFSHHAFLLYSDDECFIYNKKEDIPYYAGLAVMEDKDFFGQQEISGYNRVWVIYLWSERSEITEALEKDYQQTEKHDYDGNLHLELWELKPPSTQFAEGAV